MLSFGKSADYYSEKLTILGLFLKIREKKVKATFLIFFSTYLLQWGKISLFYWKPALTNKYFQIYSIFPI